MRIEKNEHGANAHSSAVSGYFRQPDGRKTISSLLLTAATAAALATLATLTTAAMGTNKANAATAEAKAKSGAKANSGTQPTDQIGRPTRFESPEAAAAALAAAVKANDVETVRKILGAGSGSILDSGDPVQDQNARDGFTVAYAQGYRLVEKGKGQMELLVGHDDWPFPFPLVQRAPATGGGWVFDLKAGKREMLDRRIGANEIDAMKVCGFLTTVQKEYYEMNPMQSGVKEYARTIVSSPGKKDGLYWPLREGEQPSPAGAVFATIENEGYRIHPRDGGSTLYHGYHFKILTGQGPAAPGGAKSYLVNDRMTEGFAAFAWPAQHDVSGVKSFMCGGDGQIHSKNLGRKTNQTALSVRLYNPGEGWTREDAPKE